MRKDCSAVVEAVNIYNILQFFPFLGGDEGEGNLLLV